MKFLLLGIVFSLSVSSPRELVCECFGEYESGNEAQIRSTLKACDVIFFGEVVKILAVPSTDEVDVTFKVQEGFKGEVKKTLALRSTTGCCDCSFRFQVGGKYLIYASREDGCFRTSICSRSTRENKAQADIAVLRRINGQEKGSPKKSD